MTSCVLCDQVQLYLKMKDETLPGSWARGQEVPGEESDCSCPTMDKLLQIAVVPQRPGFYKIWAREGKSKTLCIHSKSRPQICTFRENYSFSLLHAYKLSVLFNPFKQYFIYLIVKNCQI